MTRRTPSQLCCENLIDQFDEMLEESARRPLVMGVVLHSFILGQPHRLRQFRSVMEHILRHRDRVWLTRPGDICGFIESLPRGRRPGPVTGVRAPSAGDRRLVEAGLPESIDQLAAGWIRRISASPTFGGPLGRSMSHIRTPVMPMKATRSGSSEAPRPAATVAALANSDGDTRGSQWKEGTPLFAVECSFRRTSQTGGSFWSRATSHGLAAALSP